MSINKITFIFKLNLNSNHKFQFLLKVVEWPFSFCFVLKHWLSCWIVTCMTIRDLIVIFNLDVYHHSQSLNSLGIKLIETY